uniref:Retrotransposon gag domain-containing protein n=1 Tax=Tanacetum cinerariifolium TaxID=118510 RepID=A0A6L2K9G5_TANCI|nr:hypothetical protein [Tanacetum cinerariifolium]
MNPWGGNAAGYGEAQNRVGNVNQGQARPDQARTDLALNADNVFQAEDYDAFDSDVNEAPTAQTMFMANLSSADPITDEVRPSYDSDILSERMEMARSSKACFGGSSLKYAYNKINGVKDASQILKGRIRKSSKQKVENSNFEEHLPPIATMTDNCTMAEVLRVPTEGCAEVIVVLSILAEQFELKHILINMMTSEQFFRVEKDNPHDHIRAARRWLEKEPSRSITTWDDLVSKFVNEFFPPSRTTNLRNEISNFQQKFDESFHEAWERYKDLLRACPHHGFIELNQLDTFYNALNPADQDSLNAAVVAILNACDINSSSEIAKLTHAVNQQTSTVTTAMMAMLKQLQANPPPAQVKVVEEICVTCGGSHPYYQCLAAGGNTFLEFRDNIQGYVLAATGNYNQGNPDYRPQGVANQMRPPGFAQPNVQNNQNQFGQPQGFKRGINFNQEQPYQATAQSNQNFHLNELEKIKRMNDVSMKAMQNQIDMVKNELRNEMKTSIQTSLSNQTNEIKNMMASLLQMNTASTSGSGSLMGNTVANPKGELKAITTRSGLVTDGPTVPIPPKSVTPEEDEYVEETYTDPYLAEYTIKVPSPLVQKHKPPVQRNFVLHTRDSPLLNISELKCKALADLGASINLMPLSVWKKLADFVVVDYESDPRVPFILGRPFLRTARALIDVHGEEMILRDGDERLTLNMKHDTASYSNHPHRESVNLINIFNVSSEDCLEFDIESDLREIEFLLYQGKDSDLKDLIDQTDLANLDDYFVDPTPEMFTDEHAPDYSSPLIFDVYDDDFLEIESDANNVYDDPFDSKGEKIKESKLLMDELDIPCDILPYSEYKVFNPGILIQEKSVIIITRVAQEKKLAISKASLVFEDFDPPFYEPLVFKDVPNSMRLLPFSSKNEEKVFKPGIYTSKKVHFCFLLEISHPGYHVFKVNQIFISLMRIFHVQCGKNTPLLDVLLFYFHPS